MSKKCGHAEIIDNRMECEKQRQRNLTKSPYYARGLRAGRMNASKKLDNPYLGSAGEAWQLGVDEATRNKDQANTKSYYKFCVVCGQEEGFPEYPGHEPTDHTCFVCK